MKKIKIVVTTLWLTAFPLLIMVVTTQFVFFNHARNSKERYPGNLHVASEAIVAAPDCSDEKVQEVKASGAGEVLIDCNLNLPKNVKVTKKLIFEGAKSSGVTVNCNGGTVEVGRGRVVEIRSLLYRGQQSGKWRWERPRDITIRNCNLIGAVIVWGMAANGQGKESIIAGVNYLKVSSRREGHAAKVRDNAPTNIVFDNVVISSVDSWIPLYLSPGVTNFQLINSDIKGRSISVAIYLDAESSGNTFKNNRIFTTTTRELIAIDGSSKNQIINNWFSSLSHGGIYLYRNCGEGGVSRHSPPSQNVIVNNIFVYHNYSGFNPSIYLGSRNGNKNYCDEDDDSDFGSGTSNLDYATENVVMQNQILNRDVDVMIRTANMANMLPNTQKTKANSPNYIAYNEKVTNEKKRRAGCYIGENGYSKDFVFDGENIELRKTRNGQTTRRNYKCNDGELVRE